jgi:hypothetical protein
MGAQGARNVESGNEWGTPWAVVKEAADFLGIPGFDLDPCATAENAKAPTFFTRSDNGLQKDWFGYVWLNSPFSRSLSLCEPDCRRKGCVKRGSHLMEDQHGAAEFAQKAVAELEAGRVKAVAWHGPVAPDTDWSAYLWPSVVHRWDYNSRIGYNDGSSGGTFPSQTMFLRPGRRFGHSVLTELRPVPPACDDPRPCDGRCKNLRAPAVSCCTAYAATGTHDALICKWTPPHDADYTGCATDSPCRARRLVLVEIDAETPLAAEMAVGRALVGIPGNPFTRQTGCNLEATE